MLFKYYKIFSIYFYCL